MKKGVSMSINVLAVLMVVLIVLVAIFALFMGTWPGASSTINCQAEYQAACGNFATSGGCDEGSTLRLVSDGFVSQECVDWLGFSDENDAADHCCNR